MVPVISQRKDIGASSLIEELARDPYGPPWVPGLRKPSNKAADKFYLRLVHFIDSPVRFGGASRNGAHSDVGMRE